jgi:FixJ family two-component response regulator
MSGASKPVIAVIDDDDSVRRALSRLLRTVGMDADSFPSGDKFLEKLSSEPTYRPDCAIMDVHMPGLTGLEVQQRLKDSGLPIVIITAYEDPAIREQALAAGAIACLRKPFNDELLVSTVHAALAGKGG